MVGRCQRDHDSRVRRSSKTDQRVAGRGRLQIGVLLAIQRHRSGLTQWELAEEIGIAQEDVSAIENGDHVGLTSAQIDKLFTRLDLRGANADANFVKWWRDNA